MPFIQKIYFLHMNYRYLIIAVVLFGLYGCTCGKKTTQKTDNVKTEEIIPAGTQIANQQPVAGVKQLAPAIVYKTTKDYSQNVPVILSVDKKSITSYPAPSDIYYKGELAYPTKLADGYLLDNRGITENVAFTSYTYEEYSILKSAPTEAELLNKIIDKNPLIEIINCGARAEYKNEVEELNMVIKGGFKNFRQMPPMSVEIK